MKSIDLHSLLYTDDRGWSLDILKASGLAANQVGNLHTASLKPKSIRGNHYHPEATEWLLVFGGKTQIAWKSIVSDEKETVFVEEGSIRFFQFPPNTVHAVKNQSNHETYVLAFCDKNNPETLREVLL